MAYVIHTDLTDPEKQGPLNDDPESVWLFTEDVEFLEHFGVKGMHWGVRKKEESGKKRSASRDDLIPEGVSKEQSELLKDKFSPMTGGEPPKQSHEVRNALLIAGGAAAALGLGYVVYKSYSNHNAPVLPPDFSTLSASEVNEKLRALINEEHSSFREALPLPGLAYHWDKGVDLDPGTIVQRVTTQKETLIDDGGFFAAHEPNDVERYKGLLPQFWSSCGHTETDGYLTQIKANKGVKAPSGKESVDIMAHLMKTDPAWQSNIPRWMQDSSVVAKADPDLYDAAVHRIARDAFDKYKFPKSWTRNAEKHSPRIDAYFSEVKARGYNAVIDFNDSGFLAKTPMRYITSDGFEIVGNKPLPRAEILTAKSTLPSVGHIYGSDGDLDALGMSQVLAHFGVKGMRWGVRKEEKSGVKTGPSKLDETKRKVNAAKDNFNANREKKYLDKAASLQKELDLVTKSEPTSSYQKDLKVIRVAELGRRQQQALDDAAAAKQGRLTAGQKQALKTAAIVGGVLAAYGLYSMAQSGELNRLADKGKAFLLNKDTRWKLNPKLSDKDLDVDGIMQKVVTPINFDYGRPGTTVNCRRCTYAYEMRRRGYDVEATKTTNARGQNAAGVYNVLNPGEKKMGSGLVGIYTKYVSESVRKKTNPTADTPFLSLVTNSSRGMGEHSIYGGHQGIFDTLRQQPDGARGELGVTWNHGGGHSVAWEVVKGQPVIFDTQTGKKYTSPKDLEEYPGMNTIAYTRLDDKKLDEDFLQRWVTDV